MNHNLTDNLEPTNKTPDLINDCLLKGPSFGKPEKKGRGKKKGKGKKKVKQLEDALARQRSKTRKSKRKTRKAKQELDFQLALSAEREHRLWVEGARDAAMTICMQMLRRTGNPMPEDIIIALPDSEFEALSEGRRGGEGDD